MPGQGEGTPPGPGRTLQALRCNLPPEENTDGPDKAIALHTVARAAVAGSRRDLLVALRDRLWSALHDERTQPRDLSPLVLRLKEIHHEIASIDEAEDAHELVTDGDFDPEAI